jgi:hypothetical protein
MSAIGSYVVINRTKFAECLELARHIHSETSGKWMFKRTQVVGLEEFGEAWKQAVLKEANFEYSGYVVGNYLDAQKAVNSIDLVDQQSEVMTVLCKAFLAAFVFEEPMTLPVLQPQELLEFCREEYGDDDSQSAVEAITAAGEFYRQGLEEITNDLLVVFLIQ